MNVRKWVLVLAGMCFVSGAAFATDAKVDEKVAAEKAQIEKMKAIMAPGPAHQTLEALAGKWNYSSKFWMSPEAKPEETTGVAEHTMIYGGRFLRQEVKGTWMNQPFEGMGITGYDNIRGQYQTLWVDSMATGMMWVSGQYDAATKTLHQSGTNSCPLTGEKDRKGHSEWKVTDTDHNTYTAYLAGTDGQEFKAMEIQYQRAS